MGFSWCFSIWRLTVARGPALSIGVTLCISERGLWREPCQTARFVSRADYLPSILIASSVLRRRRLKATISVPISSLDSGLISGR